MFLSDEGRDVLKFEVRDSSLHGKGAFAVKTIRKGSLIGTYEGRPTKRNGAHVLWLEEDDGSWSGLKVTNDLRFVNHSRRPNAEPCGTELYALRTIRAGEEITFDYGDDFSDL